MSSGTEFKAIIVGGGVAGLTLALMLEQFDIDYVLLEARQGFAPQVGASIGMMPNGLLILDQLGCYDDIKARAMGYSFDDMQVRAANDRVMMCNKNLITHLEKRHGYPMLFFDRQWLLQVLYEHVKHKDRLLAHHRVSRIDVSESGVQVTTDNGKTFGGTIVTGVDGVYSKVRQEMRRIAKQMQPDYFPASDEDNASCYYRCIFGISKDVPHFPHNDQSMVTGKGRSFLVMSGPEKRVYWFLFDKLAEAQFGDKIPRYTKEDEAKLVGGIQNSPITEKVQFGDIYSKRISSTLTPLHEYVFQKWFFHRILLMGDSVHKPNPISAMGGNGAIETVADFTNCLADLKASREDGLRNLTTAEITTLFTKIQDTRHARAAEIITNAHSMQSLFAFESPIISKLALKYMGSKLAPRDGLSKQLAGPVVGGTKLRQLPVPSRPRAMPFDHELPEPPVTPKEAAWRRRLWIACTTLLLFTSVVATSAIFERSANKLGWDSLLRQAWTGRTALLKGLRDTTSATRNTTFGSHSPRVQLMYMMTQSISPLLIYTIEGHRRSNSGSIIAFPSLFIGGMVLFGLSGVVPIHSILTSWNTITTPVDRFVPLETVEILVPALTVGYVLPTIMMCALPTDFRTAGDFSRLWQFPPILFSAITAAASLGMEWWQRRKRSSAGREEIIQHELEQYQNKDVPLLRSVYQYAFAIQATAHLAAFSYAHASGVPFLTLDFTKAPAVSLQSSLGIALTTAASFQLDIVLAGLGIFSYNVYTVWDLRRAGYIRRDQAMKASLLLIIGNLLLGPGATWAGLWSWREMVVADLSKQC